MEEVIEMGIDAAGGWIPGEPEDGEKIPVSSAYEDIAADAGQMVNMLLPDLDSYNVIVTGRRQEMSYGMENEEMTRKRLTHDIGYSTIMLKGRNKTVAKCRKDN